MSVIDRNRCMALRTSDGDFVGARCQEPATHQTLFGRHCTHHAEALKKSMRNPDMLGNVLAGGRARTEEEIDLLVKELPS
jgi:hypothetical protein